MTKRILLAAYWAHLDTLLAYKYFFINDLASYVYMGLAMTKVWEGVSRHTLTSRIPAERGNFGPSQRFRRTMRSSGEKTTSFDEESTTLVRSRPPPERKWPSSAVVREERRWQPGKSEDSWQGVEERSIEMVAVFPFAGWMSSVCCHWWYRTPRWGRRWLAAKCPLTA